MRFGTFNFCRERQFGFLAAIPAFIGTALGASTATAAGVGLTAIGTAAAVGGTAFSIISAANAGKAQASTINPNPTPTAAQTVDNSGQTDPSNPQQLGRAALVYTSGQGVQGSNPSNRYALLGNASGLS